MVQDIDNVKHFTADSGKTFVRIEDDFRVGYDMFLGVEDVIENYKEEDMTEEEIKEYEERMHPHFEKHDLKNKKMKNINK